MKQSSLLHSRASGMPSSSGYRTTALFTVGQTCAHSHCETHTPALSHISTHSQKRIHTFSLPIYLSKWVSLVSFSPPYYLSSHFLSLSLLCLTLSLHSLTVSISCFMYQWSFLKYIYSMAFLLHRQQIGERQRGGHAGKGLGWHQTVNPEVQPQQTCYTL